LNSAVYREGHITLDGKKHHVVLVDYNSNGRFDDEFALYDDPESLKGTKLARAAPSDVLFIDPDMKTKHEDRWASYRMGGPKGRRDLSPIVDLDDRFYDLEVSPAGDTLTLAPSSVPIGFVTNRAPRFKAVVYGEQGALTIAGSTGKPIPLPEGNWKLQSYTIDRTDPKKAGAPKKKVQKRKKSLLSRIASYFRGSSEEPPSPPKPRFTIVSATALRDTKVVKVRKGETVEFPFGAPFKPVVTVEEMKDKETARLSMALVGSVGEQCNSMDIDGERPASPSFSIATKSGDIVERGTFEYG
jgi:hypothetical protein